MSNQPDEDEEETKTLASVSRKAWFAGHQSSEPSYESAGFRGVPGVPHGGSQTVRPEHTSGSMEFCWCGLVFDHDWPGKAEGRKHPKELKVVPATSTEEQPRIERRALRAYNADLADIILAAVNDYHVKYRLTAHSVILYPLDKTKPYAINARNGDRQVKGARVWFVKHCVPMDKPIKDAAKPAPSNRPVDEEAVKELAEMLNSEENLEKLAKNEHRFDKPTEAPQPAIPTPAEVAKVHAQQPAAEPETPVETESAAEEPISEEWVPYFSGKSKNERKQHPYALFNGTQVKCPEHGWIGLPTGLGGHTRTHHMDTTTLWGPEAKSKAIDTAKVTRVSKQVQSAIELLQEAIGVTPQQVDTAKLEDELAKARASAADWEAKYNELKAKMDLAREAFGL